MADSKADQTDQLKVGKKVATKANWMVASTADLSVGKKVERKDLQKAAS